MTGRFVRASKYRHVFGQPAKKELSYENLKISKNAWDSNLIKSNGKYISVNWESSGGGAFAVIPIEEVGKSPDQVPLFRGHTAVVLDTDFNPFNDRQLVSCSDDGKIAIWEIPENYSFHNGVDDEGEVKDIAPIAKLSGHTKKVGHVQFHPLAENVLASSSMDYTIKLWDIKTGECKITLKHKDLVTSFSFNYDGSKLVSTSRDKKIRVWDIRKGEIISEGPGHTGAKNSRAVWLGNSNRIATTGFDRFSERQLGVWDAENISNGAIGGFYSVDSSSGILMPFFDDSTKLLFIAGKGDGNIRYFEFDEENDELFSLSEFQSVLPQRGFAVAPKRTVNVHENEILRAFKSLNDNSIEPISFIVPRRSELFQDDIYPDAPSNVPALTADEWFGGKDVNGPLLISMEDIFEGKEDLKLTASKAPEKVTPKAEATPKAEDIPKAEVTPKAEVSESAPEPAVTKINEKSVPLEEKPVFTKTQEKGVDDLLNKNEVDSLLNKVNDLSDDEIEDGEAKGSTWNDEDDEIKPQPVEVPKKETTPSPKPEPTKSVSKPVTESPPVLEEKKVEAPKPVSSTPAPTQTAPVTKSSDTPANGKAITLKGTVDRLASLVEKLESTIETLTNSNLEKDERLKVLEEKIEKLISK
ncbi:hypothetical protein B5S27_g2148 [[Candida] boidinii]|nr:hypothetical protein B5S27_g2148 [[Candida] boidinii]